MFTVPFFPRHRHVAPIMDPGIHAEAYDEMPHDTFASAESYRVFLATIALQYAELIVAGMNIEFIEGDQYGNSAEMRADVARGQILVRKTYGVDYSDLPEDHPMSEEIETEYGPIVANDMFRAVHDVFGHYASNSGFGPDGEAVAWLTHRRTIPEAGLIALWCETRGQNTWTNDMPGHRDLPIAQRPFAQQKCGVPMGWQNLV